MEQNCKAYFESSIWHPTKAHGVTQKGIAGAGNRVTSHTFSYVTNCNSNEFYTDYICNMIKTPYTHTHTEYDLWDNVKINDVVFVVSHSPSPHHNSSHVFALNIRNNEYHIDCKAKCCKQRFVYTI
jgi:hypothetical protein